MRPLRGRRGWRRLSRLELLEGRALLAAVAAPAAVGTVGIPEGTPLNNVVVSSFTSSDPLAQPGDFTATIDWGDGTATSGTVVAVVTSDPSFNVLGSHTYADEGTFPTTVTVTSGSPPSSSGITTTYERIVNVTESDVLSGIGTIIAATEFTPFSGRVATFSHTGYPGNPAADFSATIDWGDGTTTQGTVSSGVSGSFLYVSGSHTYQQFGSFQAIVALRDDSPGTASAMAVSTVNVAPGLIVTNTNDSGRGSLRQAINTANALGGGTILFEIPTSAPFVVHLLSPLTVTANNVIIDATASGGFNGTAPFVLDGSQITTGSISAAATTGASSIPVNQTPGMLVVNSQGVVIRGLTFEGFDGFGVVLGAKSGHTLLAGDNFGTDATGTVVTQGNTVGGVLVLSADNTIGGTLPEDLNVISGNATGIYLFGAGATGNLLIGNHIGTDRSGNTILGNPADKLDGIAVDGALGNMIGLPNASPGTGPGNLIAGYQVGIYLFDGASNNVIQGNAIRFNGINPSGAANPSVELGGVLLSSVSGNQVGTSTPGSGNDISGNQGSGVVIFDGASGNSVASNTISNNADTGVYIYNTSGNRVGTSGAGNTISGNGSSGVDLEGASASQNTVQANTIRGNQKDGVYLFNAPRDTIGGATSGEGNVIQGNGFSGVHLEGRGAIQDVVQGNTITDQSQGFGVLLENRATQNTIGGIGDAANTFRNDALGNIQVLINGLPPFGDLTGGNIFAGNNSVASGQPATSHGHSRHRPTHPLRTHAQSKAVHSLQRHPAGPLHLLKKVGHLHAQAARAMR
jgi:parallel beta-helix repeat protein